MKKSILIIMIAVLVFSITGIAGCGSNNKLKNYYRKLQNAESLTVEIEVNVPVLGKNTIIIKKDGKKTYTNGSALLSKPEEYTEIYGDTRYVYNKNLQGMWTKTVVDADTDNFASVEYYQKFFIADDYVYNKESDSYTLKENIKYEIIDGMEATALVIRFNGDVCNATGKINRYGIMIPFTLTVKEINNTKISLPKIS